MIDYKNTGARIRTVRLERKMTQEQMANAVGITNISHIETGNRIPSLQAMADIIHALKCFAGGLLCAQIDQARLLLNGWCGESAADCSGAEVKLMMGAVEDIRPAIVVLSSVLKS